MCKCRLCFAFTHHEAEFAVTFGRSDRLLEVCRFCQEDLALLGFRANQIVRLEASKPLRHRIPLALVVLGPVYTLLQASMGEKWEFCGFRSVRVRPALAVVPQSSPLQTLTEAEA